MHFINPLPFVRKIYSISKNGGAHQLFMKYIDVNKNFICSIQGKIAVFNVAGAERHKALRLAIQAFEDCDELEKKAGKKTEIAIAKKNLDDCINLALAAAADAVFSGLKNYFEPRNEASIFSPRFCIKLFKKQDLGDVIYTFARDAIPDGQGEVSFESACEENTGFQEAQNGTPYLCNDIPSAKGAYRNPRLNLDRFQQYKTSIIFRIKKLIAKDPVSDTEWISCWDSSRKGGLLTPMSCYKSTLIMPMTLLASQVSEEFVRAFGSHWGMVENKYNFGYICIDCHESNFFENYDKTALFVHADMFSLFLIMSFSYREHSATYKRATDILLSQRKSKIPSGRKPKQRQKK